jgi:hypothetical protein
MARTWKEQWADDGLLITVHGGVSLCVIVAPLIVAWAKNVGEIGWIICVAISGFVLIGSGRYILSRAERKGKTERGTAGPFGSIPQAGASVIFEDSDIVKSRNELGGQHYVIYKGKRHGLHGYDLVRRAFPKRHYVEGSDFSDLDPPILRKIPEGRELKTETDLQEIFFQNR